MIRQTWRKLLCLRIQKMSRLRRLVLIKVVLRWGATASGQKLESFIAVIKHSSKTDGSGSWPNSTKLRSVEARTTSAVLPLMNGEYLIKFENEQRQRSTNAISAVINVPDLFPGLTMRSLGKTQTLVRLLGNQIMFTTTTITMDWC